MDKILSIGRVLELSEATRHASRIYDHRYAEIQKLERVPKIASKAMLVFANKYPQATHKSLDAVSSIRGYRFLGSGVEYSSYLRQADKQVIKMNRASSNCSPDILADLRDKVILQHCLLSRYLGDVVVASNVYVAEHILGGGHQILQIEQPLIDTKTNPTPFMSRQPDVNIDDIHRIIANSPGADVALGEFCNAAEAVYDAEGVLPDTNGRNNVVVQPCGTVQLIDTIPINGEHPAILSLIGKQITSLRAALKEAA